MRDYTKYKLLCDDCDIAKGKQSDEYLFTLYSADLFFYKGNIGTIDIKTGFTDGANDGGIDFVYSDNDKMYLVQGKSSEDLSNEDIENIFTKMLKTVTKFEDKDTNEYSSALKAAYQNAYDDLSDEKNIELVLFTNTLIEDERRGKIEKFSNSDALGGYKIAVYDCNDIKAQAAILNTNSDLIPEGKITIKLSGKGKNDMLAYGDNGIIVNVMASSIKKLYEKYGKIGLFSYNLREWISQKSVDDGIESTIKKEPENFWFYNNGVTIGCQDFYPDGNQIKLYGFSIINGAQTTTKIGKSKTINEKNDFALVCKIVRAEKFDNRDQDFIGKISEASNSQKPVKQRDIKANAKEQKILQNECMNNGKYTLAIEIKRGVKPKNYKKVDKWQQVSNEYIGQLIYSCILQHPGPARNGKNTMFSSDKLYAQIFKRKHDCNTLYDLVRIASIYDEYSEEKISKSNDVDEIALIKNGKLTVVAIVIYLYKKMLHIIDDFNSDKVHKDNITGLLITDYKGDDLDKNLKNIFQLIIREIRSIYSTEKAVLKVTSYSNFLKADSNYELICKRFDEIWKGEYDQAVDKEKLERFMIIFDPAHKKQS